MVIAVLTMANIHAQMARSTVNAARQVVSVVRPILIARLGGKYLPNNCSLDDTDAFTAREIMGRVNKRIDCSDAYFFVAPSPTCTS
jgi:hypothetical protein